MLDDVFRESFVTSLSDNEADGSSITTASILDNVAEIVGRNDRWVACPIDILPIDSEMMPIDLFAANTLMLLHRDDDGKAYIMMPYQNHYKNLEQRIADHVESLAEFIWTKEEILSWT